jgi:hypothetical protein
VKEQMEHWKELKLKLGDQIGTGRVEFGIAYDAFGSDGKETVNAVVNLIR